MANTQTSNQALTGRSARQVTHIRGQHGPACSTHTRTLNASIVVPVEEFASAPNKCTRCEKRHAKLLRMASKAVTYECGRDDCPGTTGAAHLQSACPARSK